MSKFLGIGLAAVLLVALTGGSAYILLNQGEREAERGSAGRGWRGTEAQSVANGQERAQSKVGEGYRGGDETGQRRAAGGGNGGRGTVWRVGVSEADHPVGTWMTVNGQVVALDDDELTIQAADGTVVAHLGPEWYWEDQGIGLDAGDQVSVAGFYEDDEFHSGRIENLSTGESVALRDEIGRPIWAGRGRWN